MQVLVVTNYGRCVVPVWIGIPTAAAQVAREGEMTAYRASIHQFMWANNCMVPEWTPAIWGT
jgi:hypothetical protein